MPIADFFILKLLNYFRRELNYDEDDMDMLRYSLQGILWEAEKIVYLSVIFIVLGLGWGFLVSCIAVMSVRSFSGGYHASTSWRCFFWMLLGFTLALLVLPHIPLVGITVIVVGIFSLIITYIATPTRSEQMRAITDTSKDGRIKGSGVKFAGQSIVHFNV